jgi:hypothetical protein
MNDRTLFFYASDAYLWPFVAEDDLEHFPIGISLDGPRSENTRSDVLASKSEDAECTIRGTRLGTLCLNRRFSNVVGRSGTGV